MLVVMVLLLVLLLHTAIQYSNTVSVYSTSAAQYLPVQCPVQYRRCNSAATVATAAAAAAAGSTHVHVQVALRVPVPPQDLSKSNSRPRIGTGAGTGISSACRYATTAAMYGIRYGIQLCSTAEHYSVH